MLPGDFSVFKKLHRETHAQLDYSIIKLQHYSDATWWF